MDIDARSPSVRHRSHGRYREAADPAFPAAEGSRVRGGGFLEVVDGLDVGEAGAVMLLCFVVPAEAS